MRERVGCILFDFIEQAWGLLGAWRNGRQQEGRLG